MSGSRFELHERFHTKCATNWGRAQSTLANFPDSYPALLGNKWRIAIANRIKPEVSWDPDFGRSPNFNFQAGDARAWKHKRP
jgi:hypothetical protein